MLRSFAEVISEVYSHYASQHRTVSSAAAEINLVHSEVIVYFNTLLNGPRDTYLAAAETKVKFALYDSDALVNANPTSFKSTILEHRRRRTKRVTEPSD